MFYKNPEGSTLDLTFLTQRTKLLYMRDFPNIKASRYIETTVREVITAYGF